MSELTNQPLTCRVCGQHMQPPFFRRPNTSFWYGVENDYLREHLTPKTHTAELSLCDSCGYIGQTLDQTLLHMVSLLYSSSFSSPGATHGQKTDYSKKLTESFFSCFDELANGWLPRRVLEVGCQSGYLLHHFRQRGSERVLGIEPGDIEPYTAKGYKPVDVKRGFLSRELVGEGDFDLVFALQVFEHIEEPGIFLEIIHDLLQPGGKLLLAVPNEELSLRDGNVGMLILQHFNYFTPSTLKAVLAAKHFKTIGTIKTRNTGLYILAEKVTEPVTYKRANIEGIQRLVQGYDSKVSQRLDRLHDVVDNSRGITGFYGANCTMSNIFSWAPSIAERNIMILDGDPLKWGQRLSGVPFSVHSPEALSQLENVIVIPYRLQEAIHSYLRERIPQKLTLHRLYEPEGVSPLP